MGAAGGADKLSLNISVHLFTAQQEIPFFMFFDENGPAQKSPSQCSHVAGAAKVV